MSLCGSMITKEPGLISVSTHGQGRKAALRVLPGDSRPFFYDANKLRAEAWGSRQKPFLSILFTPHLFESHIQFY